MRQHRLGLDRAASIRKHAGATPTVMGRLRHADGAPAHTLRVDLSLDLNGRDHPLAHGVSGPDGRFSVPVRLPALAIRKHVQAKVLAMRPALQDDEPITHRWTVVARARSAPLTDLSGVDLGDVVVDRWTWREGPIPRLQIDPDEPADIPPPAHATARDTRWSSRFADPPPLLDAAPLGTPESRQELLVDLLGAGVHLHLERVAVAAYRHLRPGPIFDILMPHLVGVCHTNALAESWFFGGGAAAQLGLDRDAVALRLAVVLHDLDPLGFEPLHHPLLPSLTPLVARVRDAVRRILTPHQRQIESSWIELRRFTDEVVTRAPEIPPQARVGAADPALRTPAFRGHRPAADDMERLVRLVAALWVRATVEASRARRWLSSDLGRVDGVLTAPESAAQRSFRASVAASLAPGHGAQLLRSGQVDPRLKEAIADVSEGVYGIDAGQIEVAPWG